MTIFVDKKPERLRSFVFYDKWRKHKAYEARKKAYEEQLKADPHHCQCFTTTHRMFCPYCKQPCHHSTPHRAVVPPPPK